MIAKARNKCHTIHVASSMDFVSSQEFGVEPQIQKYIGRVVLRGDIVKMVQDHTQYLLNKDRQGSSSSQMTAAKVMDVISREPQCAGQAADAVSAYTQVKMQDAHKLSQIPKSECPDI